MTVNRTVQYLQLCHVYTVVLMPHLARTRPICVLTVLSVSSSPVNSHANFEELNIDRLSWDNLNTK